MIWNRFKKTDKAPGDLAKMSFAEHFEELRSRLFVCVVTLAVLFVICYIFSKTLVKIIQVPWNEVRESLIASGEKDPGPLVYIGPTEAFIFFLKTAFIAALFLSAPVILHQMWKFIGAGLYKHERKAINRVVPFSIGLFLGGLAFGYFVLFPIGLKFLITFAPSDMLIANITVSKYADLFFILILIMGFMFQAPLIMVMTTKVGLTTPELFTGKRRYFLVGAFVVAALFTPPDPATQLLLAGPLLILFEVGIFFSKRVSRIEKEAEEKDDSSPEMAG